MSSDVIAAVRTRKNYYRDNFRRSLRALIGCLIIIIGLLIAIVFVKLTEPETAYFATSNDGQLTQIYSAKWGTQIIQPKQSAITMKQAIG